VAYLKFKFKFKKIKIYKPYPRNRKEAKGELEVIREPKKEAVKSFAKASTVITLARKSASPMKASHVSSLTPCNKEN
jgi:hypothetical protein